MEYAENGSLASVLTRVKSGRRPRFWNPTGIAIIISGIVLGMDFVHSCGFIHRDLKPSNILINGRGEAVIADFGMTGFESGPYTQTPEIGTAHYAAPEVYRGGGEITNKADVFSFGLILHEILGGSPVFETGEDGRRVARGVAPREMPVILDQVAGGMQSLISRCWSGNPEERPSFFEITLELLLNHLVLFPGTSVSEVMEYTLSVMEWMAGQCKYESGSESSEVLPVLSTAS
jgi:serine/threonine-protein kinase